MKITEHVSGQEILFTVSKNGDTYWIKLHRFYDDENNKWFEWHEKEIETGKEPFIDESYVKAFIKCVKLANKRFNN